MLGVDMAGARGGIVNSPGQTGVPGYGARLQTLLPAAAGDVYYFSVACKGQDASGGKGGFNGGGDAGSNTGDGTTGGGGMTDIRVGGVMWEHIIAAAGGGGGIFGSCESIAGGGGYDGIDGSESGVEYCSVFHSGSGGSTSNSTGGVGGCDNMGNCGGDGGPGYGGTGTVSNQVGGGGGYYGGGGAFAAGGGGGSSYCNTSLCINPVYTSNYQNETGYLIITEIVAYSSSQVKIFEYHSFIVLFMNQNL